MANYHYEIMDTLLEYYKDEPKYFIADMLSYLYNETNDLKLAHSIEEWCDENHFCPDCGSELLCYEHEEHHTELDGCPSEYWDVYLCPNCDYNEIKKGMY